MTAPACLRTMADLVDTISARSVVLCLTHAGKLGRGSSGKGKIVAGHGLQGRGPSWVEAGTAWAQAAREKADAIEASADLVERMEAVE